MIAYHYSIYANGASGGRGYDNQIQGKGDQIRALVKLSKGEQLFILVGQMGVSGCRGCEEIAVRSHNSLHTDLNLILLLQKKLYLSCHMYVFIAANLHVS